MDGRPNCRSKVQFSNFSVVSWKEPYNDPSQRSSPPKHNYEDQPVSPLTLHHSKNKNKNEFSCYSITTKDLNALYAYT